MSSKRSASSSRVCTSSTDLQVRHFQRMAMRAIEAKTFSGYGGLRQIELPKPQPAKDRVLVRVTAAGVTPLDHTILSGGHPRAKAPLVLGNEGAGVIEDAGDSGLAAGSRVMFTGPYGVGENGAWQEWLLAQARRSGARARRDRRCRRGQPSGGLSDCADHVDAGRIQAGHDGAGSGDRRVGRQRDVSARAGAGRRQGDIDGRQRGESR